MSNPPVTKWKRADFRLHPGNSPTEPHWLLEHLYGRVLLAAELRRTRPDLECSRYDPDPALAPQLDCMIDRLGLRKWPRPSGIGEQLRAVLLLVRMACAVEMNEALPASGVLHWS